MVVVMMVMVNFVGCEVFTYFRSTYILCSEVMFSWIFSQQAAWEGEKEKNVLLVSIWNELNKVTKYYFVRSFFTIFVQLFINVKS